MIENVVFYFGFVFLEFVVHSFVIFGISEGHHSIDVIVS